MPRRGGQEIAPVTLEFEKVQEQVSRMGRALAHLDAENSERLDLAWHILQEQASDLDVVNERIQLVRQRDAGFRGAAPLTEPLNRARDLPPAPDRATILAVDGSQIYPSTHGAALYYLTNIGLFAYHHGTDALPEQYSEPRLHYSESDLRDAHGQVITNEAVNARRNVLEMLTLSRAVWDYRDSGGPILALRDGQLLFWVGKDVPEGERLEGDYMGALVNLYDAHADLLRQSNQPACLAGYVDRPSSAFLVSLLHLLSLPVDEVRAPTLKTNGALEGLIDQVIMRRLLRPGQRSALMVQQSPLNKHYHDKGAAYEIVFFYINIGLPGDSKFARVELPMWVAREPAWVDLVHALVYHQSQIMWHYPYALARADELAVVRNHEREHLDNLIKQALLSNAQPVDESEKLSAKAMRHGRTRYGQKKP